MENDEPSRTLSQCAGYECQEYVIPVAGMALRLLGPKYPHRLNEAPRVRQRGDEDGYRPFWAQPWPAAVMLAEYILQHAEPGSEPILELGAGLGIVGISLSLAGYRVVVTDYDEDALAFVRASARINGIALADVRILDWRDPPPERYTLIVGSEIVYERRSHRPLADLLARCLKPAGSAVISDTNRTTAGEFPEVLRQTGLSWDTVPVQGRAIPAFDATDGRVFKGRIFRIFRGAAC